MPTITPSNHPPRRPSTPPTKIRMELNFRITATNSSSNIIQPLISRVLWRAWQMTWRTVIWAHFYLKIIILWRVFKIPHSRKGIVRVIRRIINSKSGSLLSMVEVSQIDRGQHLGMALVKWATHSPIWSNPSRRDSPWLDLSTLLSTITTSNMELTSSNSSIRAPIVRLVNKTRMLIPSTSQRTGSCRSPTAKPHWISNKSNLELASLTLINNTAGVVRPNPGRLWGSPTALTRHTNRWWWFTSLMVAAVVVVKVLSSRQ
jgi:hypothetical protein